MRQREIWCAVCPSTTPRDPAATLEWSCSHVGMILQPRWHDPAATVAWSCSHGGMILRHVGMFLQPTLQDTVFAETSQITETATNIAFPQAQPHQHQHQQPHWEGVEPNSWHWRQVCPVRLLDQRTMDRDQGKWELRNTLPPITPSPPCLPSLPPPPSLPPSSLVLGTGRRERQREGAGGLGVEGRWRGRGRSLLRSRQKFSDTLSGQTLRVTTWPFRGLIIYTYAYKF